MVLGLITDFVTTVITGWFTLVALVLALIMWPTVTETTKLAAFTVVSAMGYDAVMNGPNEEFTLGDLGVSAAVAFGARQVM